MVGVDAIAGLLDGPRAREAFVLRIVLDPPWSLRVEDRAPVTVIAAVRGDAWIAGDADSESSRRVRAGEIAVVRGPDAYTIADDLATPNQVVVHPGQRCTTLDGVELAETMRLGVRTWGTNPDGEAMLLVGAYESAGEVGRRLLDALPPVIVLPADALDSPLVALLAEEAGRDAPGQEAVLDRLLDLLLIAVLRAWFARPEADAPAWYRAQGDPVVGPALRMLQNNPDRPWTVASLAREVGISRAALARRFNELVGEPPMSFLTEWRLTLAADLLLEPGATVGSVAPRVGYATPYALSTAFKRVRGVSPKEHRLRFA
jgi:AraC-like DNA-binding protein